MRLTKDQVKNWLKKNKRSRDWLAQQCQVSKATVNTWLSSDRGIPAKAVLIIQSLMKEQQPKPAALLPSMDARGRLEIRLDYETQRKVETESLKLGMTLTTYCTLAVEWCGQRPHIGRELSALLAAEKRHDALANAAREKAAGSAPESGSESGSEPERPLYDAEVVGNIAAGNLMEGDAPSSPIRIHRPLKKGEYIVRVNGSSMEPIISDGSHIILKKYPGPDMPKSGTIVEYNDGRGVTLKRLSKRGGDWVLESANRAYPEIEPIEGGNISALYVETL